MRDNGLRLQRQRLIQDDRRHNVWEVITEEVQAEPARLALILCDVWDSHWCQGAVDRLQAMPESLWSALRALLPIPVYLPPLDHV